MCSVALQALAMLDPVLTAKGVRQVSHGLQLQSPWIIPTAAVS